MVWANFHNVYFFLETCFWACLFLAALVLADFSGATARDESWLQGDIDVVFLHLAGSARTMVITESFVLAVWVPLVVGLIVTMVLVEGVVDGTVSPVERRNAAIEPGNLDFTGWMVVVVGTNWVKLLVEIRMDDLVGPVVMRLLPEVLMPV